MTYKEWPVFDYLDSNYGAILGGLGDKRKAVYSPLFLLFTEKV
jgi:hypothetical protein